VTDAAIAVTRADADYFLVNTASFSEPERDEDMALGAPTPRPRKGRILDPHPEGDAREAVRTITSAAIEQGGKGWLTSVL